MKTLRFETTFVQRLYQCFPDTRIEEHLSDSEDDMITNLLRNDRKQTLDIPHIDFVFDVRGIEKHMTIVHICPVGKCMVFLV